MTKAKCKKQKDVKCLIKRAYELFVQHCVIKLPCVNKYLTRCWTKSLLAPIRNLMKLMFTRLFFIS